MGSTWNTWVSWESESTGLLELQGERVHERNPIKGQGGNEERNEEIQQTFS